MPKLIKKYQKLSNYYYLLILFGLIENWMVFGYTLSENTVIPELNPFPTEESNENSISSSSLQHTSPLTRTHHRHHHSHEQENHQHLFRHRHHQKKHHNSNGNSKHQKDELLPLNGSVRLEKAIGEFKKYQFERMQNTTDVVPTTHHKFDDIPIDINDDVSVLNNKDENRSDIVTTPKTYKLRTTNSPASVKHRKLARKSHHLRHHNRHHQVWERRVFPALSLQSTTSLPAIEEPIAKKSSPKQNMNKNNKRNFNITLSSRHFDRDGLYSGLYATDDKKKLQNRETRYYSNDFNRKSFDQEQLSTDDSFYSENRNRLGSNDFGTSFNGRRKNFPDNKSKKKKLMTKSLQSDLDEFYKDDYDDNSDNSDDYSGYDDESDEGNNLKVNNFNRIGSKLKDHQINNEYNDDIHSRSYIPGALTKEKYEMLGTREAVEESRKSYITNQRHHKSLATQHIAKISREATCGTPKPKVEKIQHDTSKLYVPHCTILHRCGDDTGCCMSDAKTCTAKKTQDIDLYFFVRSIDSKQGAIERITFKNHTECHCVRKPPIPHTSFIVEPATIRKATVLDCNCPKLFEKILEDDGNCRCDCSSSNSNCDWLKRGMEHFSIVDRRCISEGRCKPPTCEFGSYVKNNGRCPKKDDKMAKSFSSRSFH